MGSFRAGQLFGALSSGLGDILTVRMKQEQERVDREWQATLASQAEKRAADREQRQMTHAETMNQQREDAATARHAEDRAFALESREISMTAEEKRHQQNRVDNARQQLDRSILQLEEMQAKALEDLFPNDPKREEIIRHYTDQKDRAIVSMAAWLGSQNMPGFDVKEEKDLQSLLVTLGMDLPGAKDHAKQIWKSGTGAADAGKPGEDLFSASSGPDMEAMYANGGADAGGKTREQRLRRIDEIEAERAGRSAPAQQAGAPSVVAPNVQAPELFEQPSSPAPGSLGSIFNPTKVLNEDGTPKYPANENALGPRFMKWLNTPLEHYGQ